ncbi:hypothetical protein MRY87_01560 [bacterium]|nr:hypothetical protein [bacterium]
MHFKNPQQSSIEELVRTLHCDIALLERQKAAEETIQPACLTEHREKGSAMQQNA